MASKKSDVEATEPPPTSPEQPASPPGGEVKSEGKVDSKATNMKRKASTKTAGSKEPKDVAPKSFAETLASRPERTMADIYRIEPEVPENIIDWAVSVLARPPHHARSPSIWSCVFVACVSFSL